MITWSHLGTDALLPESIDSDTVSGATRDAVRLLELERIGLRPPSRDRLPTLAEIADFGARLDKSGGPHACWPHAYRKQVFCGAPRMIRQIAWYVKEGSWSPGALTSTCGSEKCGNPGHVVARASGDRDYGLGLPPDEVARFLGVSEGELHTLCRRLLSGKRITPKGLDLLVQAHCAMGGKLP